MVAGLAAGAVMVLLPGSTESAVANGDTRTLSLYHAHTHETITATFMVNGEYDQGVLDKLNWFLRDWRRDEPTKMDPHLFDTVWEVYRESGSQQPIMVMSAYRSPETNAMLRRRSRQVAEHSQHILGRAMDQHYMDVPMSKIRELGMKLQRGGVGFYPTAGTPFVHLDVGGVRHWPRMSYDQLARLFPDGKTVHIPSNGQPLPGYEAARIELASRGDESYPTASQLKTKGFFAWLFGGGGDEEDDNAAAGVKTARQAPASATRMASAQPDAGDYGKSAQDRNSGSSFFSGAPRSLFGTPFGAPARAPEPAPVAAAPVLPAFAPAPAAMPAPAVPQSQPIPQQAVALAVPPATPAPDADPDGVTPIRNLPLSATLAMPLPPRRPSALANAESAAPLPPLRPTTLASLPLPHDAARPAGAAGKGSDAIAALLTTRTARLPDVITQGAPGAHPQALGYSAMAALGDGTAGGGVPLPVARPAALLSPHLDRTTFRSMTRPDSTTRTGGRSALGAAIPPLRAGARADLGALAPTPAVRGAFQARASDLSTDAFSGSAPKPVARAGTGLD